MASKQLNEKLIVEANCAELLDTGDEISLTAIYDMLRRRYPALCFYGEDKDIKELIDGSITIELFPNSDRKIIRLRLKENANFKFDSDVCFEVLPKAGTLITDMMTAIITRAGRPAEDAGSELATMRRHINRVFGGMGVTIHNVNLIDNCILNTWVFLLSFKGQYAQIVLPVNYFEKKS